MGGAAVLSARAKGLPVDALSREDADVSDESSLQAALSSAGQGDVVINAAAVLGTREAEADPLPQLEINVRGALRAAQMARRRGAAIVHFSTDYVFDGTKEGAYVESDAPNPINMYGALKLASELLVRAAQPAHYVLRVSSLFGASTTKRPNFVERMSLAGRSAKTVAVRGDVMMSPTYARDAADIALELVCLRAPYGLYHASNAGACSWLEFAQAIFDLSGIQSQAIALEEETDDVARPRNSALKSEKLESLKIEVRPWREALAAFLGKRL